MRVVDQQSNILFSNKQASAMFGYSAEELHGNRFTQTVGQECLDLSS